MGVSERVRAACHSAHRLVRRSVRTHFYWRSLRDQMLSTAAAAARYEAVCEQSPLWTPPVTARPIRLPSCLYRKLSSVVESAIDPAVSARHRRLEGLYVSVSRSVRDEPAFDPLITSEGLTVQGVLARDTFRRLLGVTLSPRVLTVVRRYGSLDTAIRDLLAQSGYSQRVPDFAPVALDWRSFTTFAEMRHRRRMLLARSERPSAGILDLGELWLRAREVAQRVYWERRDRRQQFEWENARRSKFLSLQDRLSVAELQADARHQSECAFYMAHEVFGGGLARMADLAEHIRSVDPSESESDTNVSSASNALDDMARYLSDNETKFDNYLRRS